MDKDDIICKIHIIKENMKLMKAEETSKIETLDYIIQMLSELKETLKEESK
jgi:hypothetical protein